METPGGMRRAGLPVADQQGEAVTLVKSGCQRSEPLVAGAVLALQAARKVVLVGLPTGSCQPALWYRPEEWVLAQGPY